MFAKPTSALLVTLVLAATSVVAAEGPDASSGFLTDYSLLKPAAKGQVGQFIYIAPTAVERLGAYNAGLVDQPALAIAADSKVKSLKPDDAKLIADAFRQVMSDELAKGYQIVDRPGKGVLAIRTSFSNVYVQKKGRGLLGYTPVGFVVSTAKGALLDDVMDKVKLTQVVVEAEILDSVSGEVLAAVQDRHGDRTNKKEYASWKEVEGALSVFAQRLKCNLDNARVTPDKRQDCLLIVAPSA